MSVNVDKGSSHRDTGRGRSRSKYDVRKMSQTTLLLAEPQDFVGWTSLFVAGEHIFVPIADANPVAVLLDTSGTQLMVTCVMLTLHSVLIVCRSAKCGEFTARCVLT